MWVGIFLVLLYWVGFLISYPFHSRLPTMFFALTGLLWGMLLWCLITVLTIFLPIPFTPVSMALLIGGLSAMSFMVAVRRSAPLPGRLVITALILMTLSIIGLSLFMERNPVILNDTIMSDPFFITEAGFGIGRNNTPYDSIPPLLNLGMVMVLMHTASAFCGVNYLYALTPVLFLTTVVTLTWLTSRIVASFKLHTWSRIMIVIGTIGVYLAPWMIRRQFMHIHTPLSSAIYLVIAIVTFWLSLEEKNPKWQLPSYVALIGYSFTRIEAPFIAISVLIIMISIGEFSYAKRVILTAWHSCILLLWYVLISPVAISTAGFLSGYRFWFVILIILSYLIFFVVSRGRWFNRTLLPHLRWIPAVGLSLILLFALLFRTEHMTVSMSNQVVNLTTYWWGELIWPGLILVWLVLWLIVPSTNNELFSISIITIALIVTDMALFRVPYHTLQRDSATRMFTIIYPVLVLNIALYLSRLMSTQKQSRITTSV